MTVWRRLQIPAATAAAAGSIVLTVAPGAYAAPAPEVEYVYDVMVRRHYSFTDPADAVRYGHTICDAVGRGDSYAHVMDQTKGQVTPNDEFAANYLISYAVNLLCPELIWQLRNSAAGYRPAVPANS
ncbi:MAG TPA: DUF732 domain-containing protein [Mycobacterium sp.]|jgi:hypothetical protein|nr:DUF732 domain-containing protein [Mycobacterium sp.]